MLECTLYCYKAPNALFGGIVTGRESWYVQCDYVVAP